MDHLPEEARASEGEWEAMDQFLKRTSKFIQNSFKIHSINQSIISTLDFVDWDVYGIL